MMRLFAAKKNLYGLVLILAILILTIIKLPYFNLPFYWDEAWSYAMAIFDMADKGPTLIPGHANEWFTRGHPLLFYFTASLWLNIFGSTLISAHIFSYLISIVSIIVCFFVFSKLGGNRVIGLMVALALMVQSVFLAQSTMLLPEIFLMTLGTLTLFYYYNRLFLGYIIAGSLLVLTKETGVVFIAFVFIDRFILRLLFYKQDRNANLLKEFILLLMPLGIFSLFLLIQKINLGYFFYPEHMGMITLNPKVAWDNFLNYSGQLIWSQGRNLWLIGGIALLLWGLIRKSYTKDDRYLIISITLFMIMFLLFSSINFFTSRYLLSVIPWYLFLIILFIYKALGEKVKLFYTVIVVFLAINLFKTFSLKGEGDIQLTYRNTVEIHKQAVNFCESQNWYGEKIYTGFLMQFNLKYPQLGYLSQKKPVGHIVSDDTEADILIFYSNESSPLFEKYKSDSRYISVKRIENNGAWVEIIKKK